jgi:dihydrodipicolinate synthase/N-acetylneuraminate lyase
MALVMGISLAGGVGLILGHSAHTTPEELAKEVEAQQNPDAGISREVNRTLLELWKMEEVEAARARSGR